MSRLDVARFTLDDVTSLYVLALQGRWCPPEMAWVAAERHMTLPPSTADDASFSDAKSLLPLT